ncbi:MULTISPECIES: aminomethyl-transferring glycine dehydrogenase [unclassified Cryobacterium]|uniref:aminomethyl-transferring glycine dehydrogenase n=1 Tax=unclassified Cryobacterium TaxID=2649013 RepID=UPI00106CAAA9|nr:MULTISPECIES: aminomethyl-transferring glycine dehydrogenase [unclassified Cryobacterium]TFC56116.1 aminomethyl-transferring glycine dehydrogenase [Cryobacterium sp. TMB3-1-2]TFC69650.1 aminomethyl-transferring glycine dehydrogenase [Cryobacterium sp. TMB3-15]TFC78016.1 aminomethyl-transferring glycine dehydrogenase [Cryobacterium sp. TMB3-10]TFD39540.1 aminomethyl-transferring glycine dehydrogenase [Cryobacterium sp. TMB3-12]
MSQPFTQRHIGTDANAQSRMLSVLGHDSVESLVNAAVPASIQVEQFRTRGDSTLPPAATEREAIQELRGLADKNTVKRSMIGLGYYDTITPAVIKRNVLENPSWYTAYTPYQPEISQGRLEAIINFQTMVADLTGMATANGSMLDESTAVVEGMLLARRASKSPSNRFIVDADALPQTHALLGNRAHALGIELTVLPLDENTTAEDLGDYFGIFVQYPGASGRVWNPAGVIALAHENKALAIVAADLLALALIVSPGELGADVAVGTSQRFGVPMGFGGPHAGYLAVRKGLERQMPGRLVGVSVDAAGHPAYRLSLQVREQHIRRDKATSNICTAQVLLAVMAGMYAVYHGPQGLKAIATEVHERAGALVAALRAIDVDPINSSFFDTVRVSVPTGAADIVAQAAAAGYNLHQVDATTIGISVDETTTAADLAAVVGFFGGRDAFGHVDLTAIQDGLPGDLARTSEYLTHAVFNTHRSETSMMRYLKRLADYDYALDRGMIPLGSCTMKLNAATEMEAVTWPEFGGLHPFAPRADVEGYLELIRQLETWLTDVTGYDTVSLQPNAGSQGELAGLLAIRGFHLANGEVDRTVCLIPSSAHGTNAASAVLAGMRVVVVACDELGNVDLDDLNAKIALHAETLAALMITYPSTHGVYEHEVGTICAAVHAAGGQVYVDGANLNALLGFARFGDFGGDVSHLNLHKTFCIPHGGGGPGVGPVAAKAHLAPFLPGHPLAQDDEHYLLGRTGTETVVHGGGPVSAAPYGSPSILPISWAYVRMMGADGLKQATGAAVLAANYVAKQLSGHYPVLYAGDNGLVAHECILDLRPLTAATGATVDDVAKRLVDYGFHAPTMSFPVAGTLMVEPTESEDLGEIDRFIEAMIGIKAEADAVAAGTWPADDNPLRNAPHTAQSVIEGEWTHPYDRETAVYPVRTLIRNKYWAPVRRIDNAYGDRNLVCACPPPEAFE